MKENVWTAALNAVRDSVVRIETPDSYGTGFLIATAKTKGGGQRAVVATAHHVLERAAPAGETIRLVHYSSSETVSLGVADRRITGDSEHDLALIHCDPACLPFPSETPAIDDSGRRLSAGTPIGWCGFPNIVPDRLCFFAGHVSAWANEDGDYLVDGVIIHGVSGGPAFASFGGKMGIIGLATGYAPNLATGQALPGMGYVRSIRGYVELFKRVGRSKNPGAGDEGTRQGEA